MLKFKCPVNQAFLVASDRNTIPAAFGPEGIHQCLEWKCPETICFRNNSIRGSGGPRGSASFSLLFSALLAGLQPRFDKFPLKLTEQPPAAPAWPSPRLPHRKRPQALPSIPQESSETLSDWSSSFTGPPSTVT